MNKQQLSKRELSKIFNEAPKEQWVTVPDEPMLLTSETLLRSKQTETQIEQWLDDYLRVIVSKPLYKKIKSTKAIVIWPQEDDEPFRPHVSDISLFRYGVNKYTVALTVKHYEFDDE